MATRDNQILHRAWMRDGKHIYTGEALLLACLVHARGKDKDDLKEVQRIMRDPNYQE